MLRLENWSFRIVLPNKYAAPEQGYPALCGNVFRHPHREDGKFVTTSRLMRFEEGKFYTKSGQVYELGVVDPEYEKAFPDARNRLIKSFLQEKGLGIDVKG